MMANRKDNHMISAGNCMASRPIQQRRHQEKNKMTGNDTIQLKSKAPVSRWFRTVLLAVTALMLAACDLEVSTTSGGKVTSNPAMINCRASSGTCVVRNYERMNLNVSTAQLIATPDAGYRLSHWSGCDRTERLHCYKNLSGNISIRAHFERIPLASGGSPSEKLRFVAVGDFGSGNSKQELVGNAMGSVCNQLGGCDFAIGLGDNIYGEAPQTPYSDAFVAKFEHPFRNAQFPFYMTLGNHDNDLLFDGFGNFNRAGEVQVEYSHRTDRVTDRWRLPSRYYEHSHPQGAGSPTATFVALDSNPFMTILESDLSYWVWYEWAQGAWVRDVLARSNAIWKIAYAHHPYLSNGSHGNAGNYDGVVPISVDPFTNRFSGNTYRQWLENNICGKVDVYVSGHDHDLQLLHSIPECSNTIIMVSGAGSKTRSLKAGETRNPFWYQRGDVLGFAIGEIEGDKLTLKFYTVSEENGLTTLAYQRTFPRRQRD